MFAAAQPPTHTTHHGRRRYRRPTGRGRQVLQRVWRRASRTSTSSCSTHLRSAHAGPRGSLRAASASRRSWQLRARAMLLVSTRSLHVSAPPTQLQLIASSSRLLAFSRHAGGDAAAGDDQDAAAAAGEHAAPAAAQARHAGRGNGGTHPQRRARVPTSSEGRAHAPGGAPQRGAVRIMC